MKKLLTALMLIIMSFGTITTFAQTTPATTQHTKKDGTPDKRYKENKTPPAQHLKKDGTPDKRFKENKTKKS